MLVDHSLISKSNIWPGLLDKLLLSDSENGHDRNIVVTVTIIQALGESFHDGFGSSVSQLLQETTVLP